MINAALSYTVTWPQAIHYQTTCTQALWYHGLESSPPFSKPLGSNIHSFLSNRSVFAKICELYSMDGLSWFDNQPGQQLQR